MDERSRINELELQGPEQAPGQDRRPRQVFRRGGLLLRADTWMNHRTRLWQPRLTVRAEQGADVYFPWFCGEGYSRPELALLAAVAESRRLPETWDPEQFPMDAAHLRFRA